MLSAIDGYAAGCCLRSDARAFDWRIISIVCHDQILKFGPLGFCQFPPLSLVRQHLATRVILRREIQFEQVRREFRRKIFLHWPEDSFEGGGLGEHGRIISRFEKV
jgi:hypothetical protein